MLIRCILLDDIRYEDVKNLARLLPPERRNKIDRLRFDEDKLLSLAAGLLIRREVGEYPLQTNEHGKPYAVGGKCFSVSHSGRCAVIAVDDHEIGVDVEKLSEKDYMKIAERFFHPNELRYVKNAEQSAGAFTRIWTRKEAYLKQRGIGIAADLRAFDTTSDDLSRHIMSCDLESYVISVCTAEEIDPTEQYISFAELKELL